MMTGNLTRIAKTRSLIVTVGFFATGRYALSRSRRSRSPMDEITGVTTWRIEGLNTRATVFIVVSRSRYASKDFCDSAVSIVIPGYRVKSHINTIPPVRHLSDQRIPVDIQVHIVRRCLLILVNLHYFAYCLHTEEKGDGIGCEQGGRLPRLK